MVRRKVIAVLCAFALMLPMAASASAYTVYTEGNISSTYLELFRGLVSHRGFTDDYVLFRSGQYEYILVIGKLKYSDGVFLADSAKEYKITNSTGTGYNSGYIYSVTDVTNVSLVPLDSLVYSNLGDFPDFTNQVEYLEFSELLLLVIALCMWLTRDLFSFNLRRRTE